MKVGMEVGTGYKVKLATNGNWFFYVRIPTRNGLKNLFRVSTRMLSSWYRRMLAYEAKLL